MTAHFKTDGNCPDDNDKFTISVIHGSNTSRQFFTKKVGIGSSEQLLVGDFVTSFCISTREMGKNSLSDATKTSSSNIGKSSSNSALISVIFFEKKELNLLVSISLDALVGKGEVLSLCMSDFRTLERALGSREFSSTSWEKY